MVLVIVPLHHAIYSKKGKVHHTPLREQRRVLISLSWALSPTRGQCNARPMVTFPAVRHHRPFAGTKLYCLVTEVQVR